MKIVSPDESRAAQFLFDTTQARARTLATSSRAANAPLGTRVTVHKCFNDEPDATRVPCQITDAWDKQASGWVRAI